MYLSILCQGGNKMKKTNGKKKNMKKNNKEEIEKTKKYKTKTNKKEKKAKKKHPKLKKAILIIFVLGILLCLIGVGIIAGIFFSDQYKVTRSELQINNFNTKVADAEGNIIATINGKENRKWVTVEEMPEYLPKLFVALEDERFYNHKGIDLKRTLGATLQFVFKGGSSSYGGSTITQQLIKNTFDDKDDSGLAGIERKIREMARAYNTEQVLSKDEILELYLNKIFMGGTYYGVGTAAEYYFSKEVKDLSLAEAAYLVAINTSPNAYDPFSTEQEEIDTIKNKVKVVLEKFREEAPNLEYDLTEEAYNTAVAEVEQGLAFQKGNVITTKDSYSYLVDAALQQITEQLAEEQGLKLEEAQLRIENNGYTIYTTQINSIQEIMQNEFVKDKYLVNGKEKDKDGNLLNEGHTQAAMAIIDPSTGYVVGCMGGLGPDSNPTGYNRVIKGSKQPGSSIKPIGVVAPALEKGIINASTVYDDSYTVFSGRYDPHNSDYSWRGLLTVRHAIEHSSNVIHVKIMAELGPSNSANFLREMNFTQIADKDLGLPLALGATSVTPLEMAAAYAMIANNGVYIEPTFYTKVEDMDGNVIMEPKQETKRMMTEQNAYILKEILTEPVTGNGGTATTCWIKGMEVGAKTGSTGDYKDRWLCGITPYYAGACWFGFDRAEQPKGISGNGAATLWGEIMRAVHTNLPSKRFEKPSGVVSFKICLDSGNIATDSCTRTEMEYFTKGNSPKQCEGHTKLKICKETGKIATEYCKDVEEKTYLVKPQKENTKLWSTNPGDKYDIPTETCDVHKAPEQVEMINVVGKTLEQAKKDLEAKGLKVEVKYSEDKSKKDGIVLKQSVEEKKKVDKGTTITLTVNKLSNSKPNENTLQNTTIDNTTGNTTVDNTTTGNTTVTNTTNTTT